MQNAMNIPHCEPHHIFAHGQIPIIATQSIQIKIKKIKKFPKQERHTEKKHRNLDRQPALYFQSNFHLTYIFVHLKLTSQYYIFGSDGLVYIDETQNHIQNSAGLAWV